MLWQYIVTIFMPIKHILNLIEREWEQKLRTGIGGLEVDMINHRTLFLHWCFWDTESHDSFWDTESHDSYWDIESHDSYCILVTSPCMHETVDCLPVGQWIGCCVWYLNIYLSDSYRIMLVYLFRGFFSVLLHFMIEKHYVDKNIYTK